MCQYLKEGGRGKKELRSSSMWSSPTLLPEASKHDHRLFSFIHHTDKSKSLPLKVCLCYDAFTFNTAGTIQNPSRVSSLWIPSTRGARWSVICGLIGVWIDLIRREKTKQPRAFLKPTARNKPSWTNPHQNPVVYKKRSDKWHFQSKGYSNNWKASSELDKTSKKNQ